MQDIKRPESDEHGNGIDSLMTALALEKKLNGTLLELHALASDHSDSHLEDYLEKEFLNDQVDSIKKFSDMITKLRRAGPDGLGEYLFDKDLSS